MLSLQEIVTILQNASPILISRADLENAITIVKASPTVDALVILQALYYLLNGGIAGSYLAVADVDSKELRVDVEEKATSMYLAYIHSFADPEYLYEFKIQFMAKDVESVIVTGDFDGWRQSCALERDGEMFFGIVNSLLPTIVFRFLVDGHWLISELYETVEVDGVLSNFLEVDNHPPASLVIEDQLNVNLKPEVLSDDDIDYEIKSNGEVFGSVTEYHSVIEALGEAPTKEQTVALIKPDAYGAGRKDAIYERILEAGFTIAQESELIMTLDQATEFYKEHEGKSFYDNLINWMSSAPIYAMVLERNDAIKAWRTLAGPTNSNTARETAPERYSLILI
jgi:nucleoside diphosphate kinase